MDGGHVAVVEINSEYKTEGKKPLWVVSCRDKDSKRYFLNVEGVEPSFGVPYEEFWKLHDDKRVVKFRRGPDSPFGDPVIEVFTPLPEDIGGNKTYEKRTGLTAMREMVTHSYQADVKFEKKVKVDLGIKDNYFTFEKDKVDQYGYIDAKYIKPLGPEEERFDVKKLIVYWDTEWEMKALLAPSGRVLTGPKPITDGKYKKAKVITVSFLDSEEWAFEAFTWHPEIKSDGEFDEKYISRVKDKFRKRIAAMPKDFPVKVHKFTNEKAMLEAIVEYISRKKPDCMVGFNAFSGWHGIGNEKRWINGFDMPWFYKRCLHLGVPAHRMSPMGDVYDRNNWGHYEVVIKLMTCLDLWHAFAFFGYAKKDKLKSEKLNTFMEKYLGVGKIEYDGHVWDMWLDNPKKEREYNQADTEGTAALEVMFNPTGDAFNRAQFAGGKWEDGMFASKLHDQINLNEYKGEYYLDTKYQDNDDETGKWKRDWINDGLVDEKIGGFNPEPFVGMWNDVIGLDFKGFYPSAGMVANCAPETFINVVRWGIDKHGLYLMDRRRCLKREVEDWDAFLKEMFDKWRPVKETVQLQDMMNEELLGWKETKYYWEDVIRTPGGFFRKDIVSKGVKVFKDLRAKRAVMSGKAGKALELTKDKEDFNFKLWDQRSFSFKGLINGKFGISGMEAERSYMLAIFNTYTLVCQEIIKRCMEHLIDVPNYKVILGATDSMYVPAKRKPEYFTDKKGKVHLKEMDELVEEINAVSRKFAKEEFNMDDVDLFEVEGQDFSDHFFIRNKKFYLKGIVLKDGVMLPKRQVEFKGVKKVRREVAEISEKVQDGLGEIIMANEGADKALEYLQDVHSRFSEMSIISLSKVMPVKQKVDDYSEGSEQWKAFKLGEYFGIDPQVGDRYFVAPVKYCPAKILGENVDPALGDVVAFSEDTLHEIEKSGLVFNREELENKAIAGPVNELLEVRYGTTYWEMLGNASVANPFEEF